MVESISNLVKNITASVVNKKAEDVTIGDEAKVISGGVVAAVTSPIWAPIALSSIPVVALLTIPGCGEEDISNTNCGPGCEQLTQDGGIKISPDGGWQIPTPDSAADAAKEAAKPDVITPEAAADGPKVPETGYEDVQHPPIPYFEPFSRGFILLGCDNNQNQDAGTGNNIEFKGICNAEYQVKQMPDIDIYYSGVATLNKLTLTITANPQLFDPKAPCLPGAMAEKCDKSDAGDKIEDYTCSLNPAIDPNLDSNRLPVAPYAYGFIDNVAKKSYPIHNYDQAQWWNNQFGAQCKAGDGGTESSGTPITIELPADIIHHDNGPDTVNVDTKVLWANVIGTSNYTSGIYGYRQECSLQGK
ncbi:MAG: hypothetical protein PHG97_01670 [Candidatus Margulisbacteria bacterium]|nr:hypothetical protein [Candidatus Margulisiibacteriota bacterium]